MKQRLYYGFFWLSALAILGAYYTEYILHFEPCSLCLMQRYCLICSTVLLLSQALRERNSVFLLEVFILIAGIFFALRQAWLASLPVDMEGICMPGGRLILEYLPWHAIIKMFVLGSQSCGENIAMLFTQPLYVWALGYFTLLLVFVVAIKYYKPNYSSTISSSQAKAPSSQAKAPSSREKAPSSRGLSAGSMDPAHKAREDVSLSREDVSLARDDESLAREDVSLSREDVSLGRHDESRIDKVATYKKPHDQ
jgi:protein dithiol:quinone oxidoreductase